MVTIVSLFDGISCGYQAFKELGVKVTAYHSFEIDRHATEVSTRNHPDITRHGSVVGADFTRFEGADYVLGGFPCPSFSNAGLRKGFEDARGELFWDMLRAIKEIKPKYFLCENVRMKKGFEDVINEALGVKPILINSALLSAQRRQRLYWTNIPNVSQPLDAGILLRDIIHENEQPEYALQGKHAAWFETNKDFQIKKQYSAVDPDKAITMTARQYASWTGNFVTDKYRIEPELPYVAGKTDTPGGQVGHFPPGGQGNRVYNIDGKSTTLCAQGGGKGAKTGLYLIPEDKTRAVLDEEVDKKKVTQLREDVYEVHGARVEIGKPDQGYLHACITPERLNKRQNGQRFNDGLKAHTITCQDRHGVLTKGYIRKLTPIECERLMNLPDGYTEGVSDSQRYKMLGNGWEIGTIKHILKNSL